jgi:hypothetical protein
LERRLQSARSSAEGANLEQAKPDESLRQKDPATRRTLESLNSRDTDGVNPRKG